MNIIIILHDLPDVNISAISAGSITSDEITYSIKNLKSDKSGCDMVLNEYVKCTLNISVHYT